MTVRRSGKLVAIPAVVAAAVALVWFLGARGAVVGVPVLAYWLVAAFADNAKVLTVTSDELRMAGYVGGPVVISRTDARTCRYVKVRPRERGVEICFFEISDASGHRLKVWRFGWWRRTRPLFSQLSTWLDAAQVEMSAQTRQRLLRLGG